MDHLPRPHGRKPFPIPCLSTRECAISLTVQTFVPFGLSNNFYHPTVGWAITSHTLEEVADFAQTWLYFGCLSLFLNRQISFAQYTRWDEEEQKTVLDSSLLPSQLMEWYEQLLALDNDAAIMAAKEQVLSFLEFIGRALTFLDLTGHWEIFWPVILSSQIVATSVRSIVKYMQPAPTREPKFPRTRYLQQKLIDAGWCPRTICPLAESDLWYLIYLDPLGVRGSHRQCSDNGCLLLGVDEKSYVTRHVDPTCKCHEITIPHEDLILAIRTEGVALIRAQRTPENSVRSFELGGILSPRITRNNPPYIAFSHVWSDGLGNVYGNRIPACQFDRLAAMTVESLQHPVPLPDNQFAPIPDFDAMQPIFWIDTLCVPVSGQERKMAITQMARVYSSAYATLALDAELEGLDSKDLRPHDALFRVHTSAWSQRLWTLQEGALASHLIFKFHDSFLDRTSILTNMVDYLHSCGPFGCPLTYRLLQHCVQALCSHSTRRDDSSSFIRVWNATQTRSVSKNEDIPICLCTLLGLDPAPVLAVTPASYKHRLITFYSLQSVYNPLVIFLPGPRLDTPGLRWAPASFCSHWPPPSPRHAMGIPGLQHSNLVAQRTREGLLINGFPGLRVKPLEQPRYCQDDHVVLRSVKVKGHKCLVKLAVLKSHVKPGFDTGPVQTTFHVDFSLPRAFILETDLFEEQDTWVKGVLCIIEKEQDGVLFVRTDAIVGLQALHHEFKAWDMRFGDALEFEEIGPEKVWCVD